MSIWSARRVRTRAAAVAALALMLTAGVASASQAETVNCSRTDFGCVSGYTASSTNTWTEKYYGEPWGNNGHNCTRYAGFRLATNGLADPGGSFGNAMDWARSVASKYGSQAVNTTPTVGSIAHWDAGEGKGSLGHVAYVEEVFADGSFVVTEDNLGGTTRRVTYSAGEGPKRFLHLADVFTATLAPTISGTGVVDSQLTAVVANWTPTQDSFAYEWYRSGTSAPVGRLRTYTPGQEDIGHTISVKVIGKRTGFTDVWRTSAGKTVTATTFTFSGTPAFTSGTAKIGNTLTAGTSLTTTGATSEIVWLRNGAVRQTGGTTLSLTSADVGQQIQVRYTFKKAGFQDTTVKSTAVTIADYTPYAFSGPAALISGTAKVEYTLSASTGLATTGVTTTIHWFRNGALVKTGGSTYSLGAADIGTKITVRYTFTKSGYGTKYYTSSAVTVAGYSNYTFSAAAPAGISGTAKVGNTLTAVSSITTSGVSKTYQWYRSGAAISGATGSSYKLTSTDKGKSITVRITVDKLGYAKTTYASAAKTVS